MRGRRNWVRGLVALVCVLVLVGGALVGCGGADKDSDVVAQKELPLSAPEVESREVAEQTVRRAQDEACLTVTSVYDYAPFDGVRDAVGDGRRGSGTRESPVPQMLASSAFYPFAASAIERLYDEQAYRAGTPPESVATSSAFVRLAEGEPCVVIATMPCAQQRAALDASGRDIRYEPVARDALLFYTRGGPTELTQDQLRLAWGAGLVGVDAPVALAHGNGSTTCFETFLVGEADELEVSTSTRVWPDMNSIIAAAALADGSLGYCYRQFWQWSCSSSQLDEVAVDGVAPAAQSVAAGEYPLLFDVCVMYDAESEVAGEAEALVSWLRSDAGRALCASMGLGAV